MLPGRDITDAAKNDVFVRVVQNFTVTFITLRVRDMCACVCVRVSVHLCTRARAHARIL